MQINVEIKCIKSIIITVIFEYQRGERYSIKFYFVSISNHSEKMIYIKAIFDVYIST